MMSTETVISLTLAENGTVDSKGRRVGRRVKVSRMDHHNGTPSTFWVEVLAARDGKPFGPCARGGSSFGTESEAIADAQKKVAKYAKG